MPRRKQRQLTQKVRVGAVQTEENDIIAVETAESTTGTQVAKVDLPAVVENQVEQDESSENRDNAGMPRRSVVLRVTCA